MRNTLIGRTINTYQKTSRQEWSIIIYKQREAAPTRVQYTGATEKSGR